MNKFKDTENQILHVTNFQDLVCYTLHDKINAICWTRELVGDFSEIVEKLELNGNISNIELEKISALQLSENGQLAREIILNDFKLLLSHGASPTLNLIKYYERDDNYSIFPTDVYSFHVDRSPIPTDTFLCTYYGDSSDILPNAEAIKKIHIPETRNELKKLFNGSEEGFESFLTEHFYDLHYETKPNANIINLGLGHLWRLAVEHPESKVPPCIHRAPIEKSGQTRLLMIC